MIKTYIKQAWALLRQNPLFSTLYVAGTGLAIAMTMIIAIIYYVKIAPLYPEENRDKILYLSNIRINVLPSSNYQSLASYKALKEWFYPVNNAVAVSASYDYGSTADYIQPSDQSGDFPVQVRYTDPAFFRIYPLRFTEGKPFTQADWVSGIRSAVITDEMAKRLFGTADGVMGRSFKLNFMDYKVAGVVQSASFLTPNSYAQIYAPYTVQGGYEKDWNLGYLGNFSVVFMVASSAQQAALQNEIKDLVRKVNIQHAKEWKLTLWDQPTPHLLSVFHTYPGEDFSLWGTVRHYLVIFLVLLLVPALNLSGMISSRMESRLAEMGVRKSFGACRKGLLSQVMWENLLLTLLGGLVGLVLAWLTLYVGRTWVFSLFESWPQQVPEGALANISGEMLFAPLIFVMALVLCILLNMLSALIPAFRSLRSPIVKSLNEKR